MEGRSPDRPVLSLAPGALPAQEGANSPVYVLRDLGCEYESGGEKNIVFSGISLDILGGETIAVVGASGSGKSSLLHILGSLANPSYGSILFQGHDLVKASPAKKAELRNTSIGFVFQSHHLLPEFSTLENVAMPAIIRGTPREQALAQARAILREVGLGSRENHDVTLLSGGERQRAAIARAVLQKPPVLLADEPTGNLDAKNGRMVADLLLELNALYTMTMVIVTHNLELAARMGRCFELKSGDLYEQTR